VLQATSDEQLVECRLGGVVEYRWPVDVSPQSFYT
jgi:hypothetical protein